MENILENDQLMIQVDSYGAELHSIKKNGAEYLWQADKSYWARHAPILFPIVGKLKDGEYRLADQTYQMSGHGFARDHEFQLIKVDKDELVYELTETEDSLNRYPFEFRLRVSYKLKKNKIRIRYSVKNKDEKFMYFGIGAHPAFNVPIEKGSFEDYKLEISPSENREFIPLNLSDATLNLNERKEVELESLSLTHDLFKKDALIFKSSPEMSVSLTNSQDERKVKLSWKDMPYFGLWSPYPTEAAFVCIEPWCGLADAEDTDGDLSTKFAINELESEATFKCEYTIEID
ncbi:MAG: aldose 1-epimerase family protein [Lactovum sp.]